QTKETWWVSATSNNNLINYSYDDQQGKGLLVTEVTDQRNLATSPNITSRIEFAYDGLGRLVRQVDWLQPQSKSAGFELKYQYGDKLDRRTQTEGNFIGLTAMGGYLSSQPDFRNEYQWDRLNRVTKVTQNVLGSTMAGSMATVRNVDLAYYADGHLKEISRTQGMGSLTTSPIRTTISRVAVGQKNEGRISSIQHTGLAGPGSAANYSYEYDDHGRLKTFTTPAGPRTYAYDSFDQITQVDWTNQNAETYQYDANGNRTGTNRTTEANNRVREDQHYWYAYDKEGNRTFRASKGNSEREYFSYDYRNRLVSVSRYTPGNSLIQKVEYQYDGIDRRIRRTVTNANGTVVEQQRFLYDQNIGDGQFEEAVLVLNELSGSMPSSQVQHRYLNGVLVDQVFADENSLGKVLWYLQDDLQTVRDVAVYESGMPNEFARVRNHLEYDSFGKLLDADDRQTAAQGDGDRPGNQGAGQEYSPQRSYTGREPDPATGLVYYRARWYDPQLGRFISEDPLGFAAGDTNLSRYVGNSPMTATDPSGLHKVDVHSIVTLEAVSELLLHHPEKKQLHNLDKDALQVGVVSPDLKQGAELF
ncbi:MAG: RHS repeat domain-containing protein, partial [Planctomycetota bacterium]